MTRDLTARGIRDSAVFKYLRKAVGLKSTELADLLGASGEPMLVTVVTRISPSPSWPASSTWLITRATPSATPDAPASPVTVSSVGVIMPRSS